MPLAKGQVICEELEIVEALDPTWGCPSLGDCYRARARDENEDLVLTVIEAQLIGDEIGFSEFMLAAHDAQSVVHDNLAPIRRVDREQDFGVIARPWREGVTTMAIGQANSSTSQPLEPVDLFQRAQKVARALDHLHSCGFVHGCLAPGNIWIWPDALQVSQFGIVTHCKGLDAFETLNRHPLVAGLRPPELDVSTDIDAVVDVFAWGAIFIGAALGDNKVSPNDPGVFEKLQTRIGNDFCRLLQRATLPDPHQRPADAGDLLSELENIDEASLAGAGNDGPRTARAKPSDQSKAPDDNDESDEVEEIYDFEEAQPSIVRKIPQVRFPPAPPRTARPPQQTLPTPPPDPKSVPVLTSAAAIDTSAAVEDFSDDAVNWSQAFNLDALRDSHLGDGGFSLEGSNDAENTVAPAANDLSPDDDLPPGLVPEREAPEPISPTLLGQFEPEPEVKLEPPQSADTSHRPQARDGRTHHTNTDQVRAPEPEPEQAPAPTRRPHVPTVDRYPAPNHAHALPMPRSHRGPVGPPAWLMLCPPLILCALMTGLGTWAAARSLDPNLSVKLALLPPTSQSSPAPAAKASPNPSGLDPSTPGTATVDEGPAQVPKPAQPQIPAQADPPSRAEPTNDAQAETAEAIEPPRDTENSQARIPVAVVVSTGPTDAEDQAIAAPPCPEESVAINDEVCIAISEFPRMGTFPLAEVNHVQAQLLCSRRNARLCSLEEWVAACEGTPGARADGIIDSAASECNSATIAGFSSQVEGAGESPQCRSKIAAFDMVGNLGEWVAEGMIVGADVTTPRTEASCRSTRNVPASYKDRFVGFRCCYDR